MHAVFRLFDQHARLLAVAWTGMHCSAGTCLWTAHAGDCRAVLSRGKMAVPLTEGAPLRRLLHYCTVLPGCTLGGHNMSALSRLFRSNAVLNVGKQGSGRPSWCADHKPGLERERARVERCGGRVEMQRCWRIITTARGTNTGLAVSRSLGDLDFKEPSMCGSVALTADLQSLQRAVLPV